jgi:hypothetical protein
MWIIVSIVVILPTLRVARLMCNAFLRAWVSSSTSRKVLFKGDRISYQGTTTTKLKGAKIDAEEVETCYEHWRTEKRAVSKS